MPVQYTCEKCGVQYPGKRTKPSRYCSLSCKWMAKKVAYACPICGKVFHYRPSRGRQFCSRECRYKNMAETFEDRFWEKVDKSGGVDACWPWTGPRSAAGYGQFGKGHRYAHRLSWEFTHGAIPDGMELCHHCDNPPCCNPAHHFVGTHRENMIDASQKGRMGKKKVHQ